MAKWARRAFVAYMLALMLLPSIAVYRVEGGDDSWCGAPGCSKVPVVGLYGFQKPAGWVAGAAAALMLAYGRRPRAFRWLPGGAAAVAGLSVLFLLLAAVAFPETELLKSRLGATGTLRIQANSDLHLWAAVTAAWIALPTWLLSLILPWRRAGSADA